MFRERLQRILGASVPQPAPVSVPAPVPVPTVDPEDLGVLKTARSNFDNYFRQHPPKQADAGNRWESFLKRMRDTIPTFTSAQEAILYSQHTDSGFDHRMHAEHAKPILPLTFDLLNQAFPGERELIASIAESPHSRQESLINLEQRRVSSILLYNLRYVLLCKTNLKNVDSVCEIGGGNGMVAYTWLSSGRLKPNLYTIVDFPESLFFSETFLRRNFPTLRFLYVQSSEQIGESLSDYDVVLCPIAHHDAIRSFSFDLVVNTGSLHEMTEDWVEYWMDWLRTGAMKNFYSCNYFAQQLDYSEFVFEGGNSWSPRLPSNWKSRHLGADDPLVKTQTIRSFADIIAERGGEPGPKEREQALARYEVLKDRFLGNQVLLEAMEIVRISPDEDMMLHLLRRCLTERVKTPKEAKYLANYLIKFGSAALLAREGDFLTKTRQELEQLPHRAGRTTP